MRIELNITKKHVYSIVLLVIVLMSGLFAIGFGTSDPSIFGHDAGEIDLTNSITSSDIASNSITTEDVQDGSLTSTDITIDATTGRLALNVLRASNADNADRVNNKFESQLDVATAANADAANCEFLIYECNGLSTGAQCKSGLSQLVGGYSFPSGATAGTYTCDQEGRMTLCCKTT